MAIVPKFSPAPRLPAAPPHQLGIAFDSVAIRGMSQAERARVLTHLTNLLMLAAAVSVQETADDGR